MIFCTLFFINSATHSYAQDTVLNKYGIWVISDWKTYQYTIIDRPEKDLCDLKTMIPGIKIELRYASKNNFMRQRLYPKLHTTYLRRTAAEALKKVQDELILKGYSLIIFDAYRPYSVTEKMWEPVKDDRYAADPKTGSGHNRGVAVDLSICEKNTGRLLNMGTGFDDFSDTAHHSFKILPDSVLQNRAWLRLLMEKYGFKALETEWWHYSLPEARKYELLNLSFRTLKKRANKK